jgi:hypothetical protein
MAKEIGELKAEIARLKLHVEQGRNKPPTTSQNSSKPPSRDFKSSMEKKRMRNKKKDAKPGHEKQRRQLVENPNKVIEVYADHCENCDHTLFDQVPVQVIRRQTTELPEIKPVVIETKNWWQWIFPGEDCAYHRIEPSRRYDVAEEFMRECEAEVWVCDCRKAQLNVSAKAHQICLAHQIRNVQGLMEKRPRLAWAKDLNTAKHNGQSALQKLVQLMGAPVLHFLSPSV